MPRIWRSRVLLSIVSTSLVVGAASEVSVPTAHAQFPIFNGSEVLTPFGQRGSDGSYLTPYARRVAAKEKAARDKKKAAQAAQAPTSAPASGGIRGWLKRVRSR